MRTVSTPSSTFVAADGEGYELNMGRWSRRLAESFLDFAGVADGERALDVGCGTGHLAGAIGARTRTTTIDAIDVAAVYVDDAKRRYPDARLRFRVADACAIDFPDRTFDRVLSLLALHFMTRWGDAIAEMRRVAKPGAVVAAATWDARGGWTANRMFFDTAAALDPKANERRAKNFTRPLTRPGELARAWRDAGLREVVETSLVLRMEYASFADYWAPYLGRDGPGADYVRTLDPGARSRLEDAVRAAYLDGEPDGPRSYAAIAWAAKGVAPGA